MRLRLGGLLTAIVLGLVVGTPAIGVLADTLSDKQAQQQQLQQRVKNDQAAASADAARAAAAQAQLAILEPQIAAAEAQLAAENAKLDEIQGQLDQIQRDLDATQARLERRQEILNQRTRMLYKQGGNTSFIDSLFTANTFSDLMNRFILMRDITHADQVLVAQIKQDKQTILDDQAQAKQKQADQTAVRNDMQQQRDGLRQKYAEESALRVQAAAAEQAANNDANAAKAEEAQVAGEIASLLAARGRAHSSGVFAWPGVQGPITQGFGCTSFPGEPSPPPGYSCPSSAPNFHEGIDIAGPYGSTVTAADGGIAYAYSSSSGYGNHIIIVHANGFTTLYGHLAGFAIGSGQSVGKGQTIGFEGSTGYSTGPHLHFGVFLNNYPENPCNYVGC